MTALGRDLRGALRSLAASPGFTLAALLILGLGLGAGIGVFSAVRQLVLEPLHYQEPEELVLVWKRDEAGRLMPFPPHEYALVGHQEGVFDEVAAYVAGSEISFIVGEYAGEERVPGALVSANLFSLLGVNALVGRTFDAAEGIAGAPSVALLHEDLWRRRFAADPEVVGRRVRLNGHPYTVVGVIPADRGFPLKVEVWVSNPLDTNRVMNTNPGLSITHFVEVVGRLRDGVDPGSAERALDGGEVGATNSAVTLVPLHRWLTASTAPLLWALAGAVAFLLLMICSNLAHLLYVRGALRQRELAIHLVVGADRGGIVRRLLVESLLLASAGGILGIGFAMALLRIFVALAPAESPRTLDVGFDGSLVGFSVGLALLTGFLFGLLPGLQIATKRDLQEALRSSSHSATPAPQGRILRRSLVVAELALSLVLLVGAGLMVSSFLRLQQLDLGFEPKGVVDVKVRPEPGRPYTVDQQALVYEALLDRLTSFDGVEHVGGIDALPLEGGGFESVVFVEGASGEGMAEALCLSVVGDYFRALRIPVLAGRGFADDPSFAAHEVVVDELFARRHFQPGGAIGRRISIQGRSRAVVGVVGAVHHEGRRTAPEPQVYLPYRATPFPWPYLHVVVRSTGDEQQLSNALSSLLRNARSIEMVRPPRPLAAHASSLLAGERFSMGLLLFFAAAALLLAGLGVFALTSFLLTLRHREIGIRIALGATWRDVGVLVSREVATLCVLGVVGGALICLMVGRLLGHFLFGVSSMEPVVLAACTLLLVLVSLLATAASILRLSRASPLEALR